MAGGRMGKIESHRENREQYLENFHLVRYQKEYLFSAAESGDKKEGKN